MKHLTLSQPVIRNIMYPERIPLTFSYLLLCNISMFLFTQLAEEGGVQVMDSGCWGVNLVSDAGLILLLYTLAYHMLPTLVMKSSIVDWQRWVGRGSTKDGWRRRGSTKSGSRWVCGSVMSGCGWVGDGTGGESRWVSSSIMGGSSWGDSGAVKGHWVVSSNISRCRYVDGPWQRMSPLCSAMVGALIWALDLANWHRA